MVVLIMPFWRLWNIFFTLISFWIPKNFGIGQIFLENKSRFTHSLQFFITNCLSKCLVFKCFRSITLLLKGCPSQPKNSIISIVLINKPFCCTSSLYSFRNLSSRLWLVLSYSVCRSQHYEKITSRQRCNKVCPCWC